MSVSGRDQFPVSESVSETENRKLRLSPVKKIGMFIWGVSHSGTRPHFQFIGLVGSAILDKYLSVLFNFPTIYLMSPKG